MAAKTNDKNSIEDLAIAKKISEEVCKIEGVSRFVETGITKSIANVFGRGNAFPGIEISRDNEIINISLYINVYYGINIPQLSYDIQTKLKPVISEMTANKVQAININVEGIDNKGK